MINNFNVTQARNIFNNLYLEESKINPCISESREALLFTKALYIQLLNGNLDFCNDNDFYIKQTPTGYAISGFYIQNNGIRVSLNITVCKIDGQWSPSVNYIAPDTKAGTSCVTTWILLMLGCTLFGFLSYLLLKAMIGF